MKNVKVKLKLNCPDNEENSFYKTFVINKENYAEYIEMLGGLTEDNAIDIAIHLAHNEECDVLEVDILEDA